MGFYIDRHNRRKSTLALSSFIAAIGLLVLFLALYILMAEPLAAAVSLPSILATNLVHTLIISLIGTAIGCLLFLLPDKHIAPYGFFMLAMLLLAFYAAAFMMTEGRGAMLQLITIYGLCPIIIGNAVAWIIYLKMKHEGLVSEHRKTIAEELKEGIEKERLLKEQRTPAASEANASTPSAPIPEASAAAPSLEVASHSEEDALFGPDEVHEFHRGPSASDEAMLFYSDEDDDA